MRNLLIFTVIAIFCSCKPTSKTTPDNTTLSEHTYTFPQKWEEKFKIAKEKVLKKEITFDNDSKAEVEAIALILDSSNSIIKSIKTTLHKGCDGCEFSSTISKNQANHGNLEHINTSTIVTIGLYKESTKQKTFTNKIFTINSEGRIEEQ